MAQQIATLSQNEKDPAKQNFVIREIIQRVSGTREVLTVNRTYYVRTDGNDGSSGLVNSAAGAFKTIQHAVNVAAQSIDLNGFGVVIQLVSGTYSEAVALSPYVGLGTLGQATMVIKGDRASPSSYIVSPASGNAFTSVGVTTPWTLEGIQIKAAAGNCVEADVESFIACDGCDFGAASGAHMVGLYNGLVEVINHSYSISGSANAHYQASNGGIILSQATVTTVTLTGTPAWATAFILMGNGGKVIIPTFTAATWSGSATGNRLSIDVASSSGLNYGDGLGTLPGNAQGSIAGATSGQVLTSNGTGAAPSFQTIFGAKVVSSTRDMTAASGSVAYTGAGFKPTCIICLAGISGATECSIGFSDAAVGSFVLGLQATTPNTSPNGAQLIRLLDATAANDQVATLASYDADGFTLTWTKIGTPTGTATLYFLCL